MVMMACRRLFTALTSGLSFGASGVPFGRRVGSPGRDFGAFGAVSLCIWELVLSSPGCPWGGRRHGDLSSGDLVKQPIPRKA